jgi:heme/copper-type cytochrome/quinol oxidase subunit 1
MRFSILIRLEVGFKIGSFFIDGHIYNVIISSHAILIIFFIVMPSLIGGFGNWFLPVIINRSDLVFPKMNALSFWFLPRRLFLLVLSLFIGKGPGTG